MTYGRYEREFLKDFDVPKCCWKPFWNAYLEYTRERESIIPFEDWVTEKIMDLTLLIYEDMPTRKIRQLHPYLSAYQYRQFKLSREISKQPVVFR